MFRDSYQRGYFSVLFGGGSKPLNLWDAYIRDGQILRFLDPELKSLVLELSGSNISTTYISCPKGKKVLGIVMPFLILIVKNLRKYFSFEVTILDDSGTKRRFRVSNFQSSTQVLPMSTVMPICLEDGWNQINFNLADFTLRAYKRQFIEVQKLKINANIRVRRIYFSDRIYRDEELPAEYKLYMPISKTKKKQPSKAVEEKAEITDVTENKENIETTAMKKIVEENEATTMKSAENSNVPDFMSNFPMRRNSSVVIEQVNIIQQKQIVDSQLTVLKVASVTSTGSHSSRKLIDKLEEIKKYPSPVQKPSSRPLPSRIGGSHKYELSKQKFDNGEVFVKSDEYNQVVTTQYIQATPAAAETINSLLQSSSC